MHLLLESTRAKKRSLIVKVLAGIGILLQGASFFVDKSDNIQFTQSKLAPSYVREINGLRLLQSRGFIVYSDEGFVELAITIRKQIEAKGYSANIADRPVLSIVDTNTTAVIGGSEAGTAKMIEARFVDVRVEMIYAEIKQEVEQEKRNTFFQLAFSIFITGSIIQVVGLFLRQ